MPEKVGAGAGAARPALYVGLVVGADPGAPAGGGPGALREFLGAIRADTGVAFVVVQRPSPGRGSVAAELLSGDVAMPIADAVDGVRVEPDSVYLVPAGRHASLAGGALRLSGPEAGLDPGSPVDAFLRSVAHDAGHRGAVVVLAGVGAEGGPGVRAVKEAGGLVLVQDPDTAGGDPSVDARVDPMHVGLADFVLAPAKLAGYLEGYARHPLVAGGARPADGRLEGGGPALARIAELLRGRVDVAHYRSSSVARRIERRMAANRIEALDAYLALLERDEREVSALARELLVDAARFFDDADAFDWLERRVVRPAVGAEPGGDVRVWVAGCSTGEEAYSVAMLFAEAAEAAEAAGVAEARNGDGGEARARRVEILATDVHEDAVAEASLGRYPAGIEADVSPERLARHFTRAADGTWTLRPEIRRMVAFAAHDPVADPPFADIDLVCCRNALVRFQQPVQRRIVASFHVALRAGGHLFLGPSEGIGELSSHFDVASEAFRVYRKVADDRVPISTSVRPGAVRGAGAGLPPVTDLLRGYRASRSEHAFEHVKDALINDHVPACLILDAERRVVHLYGDADEYLTRFPRAGRSSADVLELVAKELVVALDASLERAARDAEPVSCSGIEARLDGRVATIDLRIEHHPGRNGRPAHFVVLLDEGARRRAGDLELANEELRGVNDRLRSTNRALSDANAEYRARIAELTSGAPAR